MSTPEIHQQKVQNLQHSVRFLQREHAVTLDGLYKEISKLQKKCSLLTFDLAQYQPNNQEKREKGKSSSHVSKLRSENAELLGIIETRDRKILLLDGQLKAREQKYVNERKHANRKISSLQAEIDNKNAAISYLNSQLQRRTSFENVDVVCSSVGGTPLRRRSCRLATSAVTASVDGLIEETHNPDMVLQSTLQKKNNGVRLSAACLRHSESDHTRPSRKPRPTSYDFVNINVTKSSVEPLPPITTRSGRQLSDPARNTNSRRVLKNRHHKAMASSNGEVEQLIKDNALMSPEKPRRRVPNSLMKE